MSKLIDLYYKSNINYKDLKLTDIKLQITLQIYEVVKNKYNNLSIICATKTLLLLASFDSIGV